MAYISHNISDEETELRDVKVLSKVPGLRLVNETARIEIWVIFHSKYFHQFTLYHTLITSIRKLQGMELRRERSQNMFVIRVRQKNINNAII